MIPIVLLIWAGVGWRYVGWTPDDSVQLTNASPVWSLDSVNQPDTFTLLGGYKDPFLGTLTNQRDQQTTAVSTNLRPRGVPNGLKRLPTSPAARTWPMLHFMGRVQGPDSSQATALMQVDDQIHTVRSGDSLAGFMIRHITAHEIHLQGADTLLVLRH